MNKTAIKNYAVWARVQLIEAAKQRAYQYDITEDGYGEINAVTVGGRALSMDEQNQRTELVEQIRSKGYTQVMEEVAYTWFNRFIALRFMEVNNYLPSHVRVFSDSTGAFKPEILNDVLHLELPGLNKDKIVDFIEKNQTEDLYRYLLLAQCNALNDSLPLMFERMGSYTELLLPNNILRQDSVLGRLITDIPEEDWMDQVQIIGWLYQYYNAELKDETFALLKKNVKITKERIPSATQLFTPDWIVRYMVENSLGRFWLEGHPDNELRSEWKYYLDEAEQEANVQAQLEEIRAEYRTIRPQDIKMIDPCMGSGHILVYAFDVLVQIYQQYGISERDAAQSILENNLYGLDIDGRAAQLAYFAVMMKARQYDRRIFSRGIQPHVYSIVESNGLDHSTIDYFTGNDPKIAKDFETLVEELRDAKEYGSILNVSQVDFAALYARIQEVKNDISLFREIVSSTVLPIIQVAEVMGQQYDVVVTNPPYMAVSNTSAKVQEYVKKKYPDSKADLFAVFIERCGQFVKLSGYQAMITQHSWMFLSSFENLRSKLQSVDIVNMAHLGARAFEEIGGEVVQTTSFVLHRTHTKGYTGTYCRLIEPTTQQGKEDMFLAGENRYTSRQDNFSKIPGSLVAYWVSEKVFSIFNLNPIDNYVLFRQGMATSNNNRFLRYWHEIDKSKMCFNAINLHTAKESRKKWFPYNKGGEYRKWFGNHVYIVNWENDGKEMKAFTSGLPQGMNVRLKSREYYFKSCYSWSKISSGSIAFRYYPEGFAFDVAGCCVFEFDDNMMYYLGLSNSIVTKKIVEILSPTMNFELDHLKKIPLIISEDKKSGINTIVELNIQSSKADWNSFETSWDFKKHPLV